jgi:hypothetical protein
MVDQKESLDLYDQFASTLRRLDLGWVVEQVNQRIAAGKTVRTKEIRPFAEVLRPRPSQTDAFGSGVVRVDRQLVESKATTFIATEEFTASERLLLLIAAIERAVVDTYEMERALPSMLAPSEPIESSEEGDDVEGAVRASLDLYTKSGTPRPSRVRFSSEVGETEPIEVGESSAGSREEAVTTLSQLIAQLREEIRA